MRIRIRNTSAVWLIHFLAKVGSRSLYLERGMIFKKLMNEYFMENLNTFFLFPYFWLKTSSVSCKALILWSQSRALRLTEHGWNQKYGSKKEGSQRYLKYLFNSILYIIPRSRYRALDPNLVKKRIHTTALLDIYLWSGGIAIKAAW